MTQRRRAGRVERFAFDAEYQRSISTTELASGLGGSTKQLVDVRGRTEERPGRGNPR
jgi:hypothetical protein